jgi:hypothetical protein
MLFRSGQFPRPRLSFPSLLNTLAHDFQRKDPARVGLSPNTPQML